MGPTAPTRAAHGGARPVGVVGHRLVEGHGGKQRAETCGTVERYPPKAQAVARRQAEARTLTGSAVQLDVSTDYYNTADPTGPSALARRPKPSPPPKGLPPAVN